MIHFEWFRETFLFPPSAKSHRQFHFNSFCAESKPWNMKALFSIDWFLCLRNFWMRIMRGFYGRISNIFIWVECHRTLWVSFVPLTVKHTNRSFQFIDWIRKQLIIKWITSIYCVENCRPNIFVCVWIERGSFSIH